MTHLTRIHVCCLFLLAVGSSLATHSAIAQTDKLKQLQLANDRMYRDLNNMGDKGESYQFTNVVAWHVTDTGLYNEIANYYRTRFGDKQFKDFRDENIYVFSVPLGEDRYFPFHVLFTGKRVVTDTSAEAGGGFEFAGRRATGGKTMTVVFKGRDVVQTMLRQPQIMDDISAIQGETVEMPQTIAPRGAQLIKDADERYIFHEMFVGPYSKRTIINEQARLLNQQLGAEAVPLMDENFDILGDSTIQQLPVEGDQNASIGYEVLNSRAFRYQPHVDVSIDHLGVNLSRQNQIEIQLGNPEVGLPFWSSGEGRLSLNMRNQIGTGSNFKLGLDFPLNLGREDGLVFQARKLSGFWGGSLSAYFSGVDFFSAFNMPIAFNFTFIPAGGSNSSIIYNGVPGVNETGHNVGIGAPANADGTAAAAAPTFYRTSFIGQLYVPFIVQLNQTNFMQFSAGVGIHQVKLSWIPRDTLQTNAAGLAANQIGSVQDLLYNGKQNVSTPFTPHVSIELVNHLSNKFGLNFQYDHLFTFGGWLELVPDHLRIEASYTAPLVREPLPYEPKYFFEITPRLYF